MAGRSRIRTDLALEATERFQEENVEVRGVEIRKDTMRKRMFGLP